MPSARTTFAAIIDTLIARAERGDLTIGAFLGAFGERAYGAMLVLPCLLIVLPSGMIPGFPALGGIVMIFVAGHLIVGADRLWLPRGVAERPMPTRRLLAALRRLRPLAVRLDAVVTRDALAWFATSRLAAQTAGAVTALFSLSIIAIGFIPGVPAILCIPILILALGLTAENGALMLLGYIVAAIAPAALWWLFG